MVVAVSCVIVAFFLLQPLQTMMVRIVIRIMERMLLIVMLSLSLPVIEIMGWDGMGCDAIGWREGEERCKIKHTPQKRKHYYFNCFERNFASH